MDRTDQTTRNDRMKDGPRAEAESEQGEKERRGRPTTSNTTTSKEVSNDEQPKITTCRMDGVPLARTS